MIIDRLIAHENDTSYNQDKQADHPIRSIAKAISWRIVGTIDTMIISWFITGELTMALSIGSIEVLTKMVLYYGHERLWNIIKWRK
ncbi:MAG: DUF2061 domain-containing protein [Flavobacteriaceae bacterium]|nr:DUF2061 domain-containing protein [Flavobacteriaceae bacterium]